MVKSSHPQCPQTLPVCTAITRSMLAGKGHDQGKRARVRHTTSSSSKSSKSDVRTLGKVRKLPFALSKLDFLEKCCLTVPLRHMDIFACFVGLKQGAFGWTMTGDNRTKLLSLSHGWSLCNGLRSAFTPDTKNVQYHSRAALDESVSVSNVRHNSSCYPKVSNAYWGELQSALYCWLYKSSDGFWPNSARCPDRIQSCCFSRITSISEEKIHKCSKRRVALVPAESRVVNPGLSHLCGMGDYPWVPCENFITRASTLTLSLQYKQNTDLFPPVCVLVSVLNYQERRSYFQLEGLRLPLPLMRICQWEIGLSHWLFICRSQVVPIATAVKQTLFEEAQWEVLWTF